MYTDARDKHSLDFPYLAQPKLDGVRCFIRLGEDGLPRAFTRNKRELGWCVKHILADAHVRALFNSHPDLILDGELYNDEDDKGFGWVCRIVKKIIPSKKYLEEARALRFYCFDCIFLDRPDLGFIDRNNEVADAVKSCSGYGEFMTLLPFEEVKSEADVEARLEEYTAEGFEGVVMKKDAPYRQGRSSNLLKYKRFTDAEFEVVEILEGTGRAAGRAASVRLRNKAGVEFKAGVGGVLPDSGWDKLKGELATVVFQGLTPLKYGGGGVPRFGKVTCIRNYE